MKKIADPDTRAKLSTGQGQSHHGGSLLQVSNKVTSRGFRWSPTSIVKRWDNIEKKLFIISL
jgi:hypothetical protein